VITRGQDVRQARQVSNLLHGLSFVGEFEQIEIGVRHHHKLCLAADPSTHVHISVSGAWPRGIDIRTDSRRPFPAIATTPAGDVKGNGYKVADPDELHVAPSFYYLARNFMAEDKSLWSGGPATNHVLIAATDIGGNNPENDPVFALPVS
jgi:hypothetical protein